MVDQSRHIEAFHDDLVALLRMAGSLRLSRAYVDAGAPYGTERKAQESLIKWALLRLFAGRVILPRCTTLQRGRHGRSSQQHYSLSIRSICLWTSSTALLSQAISFTFEATGPMDDAPASAMVRRPTTNALEAAVERPSMVFVTVFSMRSAPHENTLLAKFSMLLRIANAARFEAVLGLLIKLFS